MRSSRSRVVLAFVAALATASCTRDRDRTWGFVATLGNDTTSVERITRQGDRIVAEAVGRSPLVVRRRWEAMLAPDGSVRRWSMDTHIANAPPGQSDLHHELELRKGAIRL